MLPQYIRPPSILIGSAQPLSGSVGNSVRQFRTTFVESDITHRIFVDFNKQRIKYSAGRGHFVRKLEMSSHLAISSFINI